MEVGTDESAVDEGSEGRVFEVVASDMYGAVYPATEFQGTGQEGLVDSTPWQ